MKILRSDGTSAVIRASWLVVQRASANPDWAQATRHRRILTDGRANTLASGALARHLGNGLWELSSARHDGADLQPAMRLMHTDWTPDLAERERRKTEASDPSWYVKLESAIAMATEASDKTGLPQTVFRNSESCGWTHTNFAANILRTAQVNSTWLPSYYWR
jgi:hypothetical protein